MRQLHILEVKKLPQFDNTTVYNSDFLRIINYECGSTEAFSSQKTFDANYSGKNIELNNEYRNK